MARIKQIAEALGQKPILLYAVLLLATMAVYAPVRDHKFLLYDDHAYVVENIHVTTGLSATNIVWAFSKFAEGNWHPLTWISHMLDCQLFGLNAGPHHLMSVALHAVNVLLLFLLLQRLTGAVWRSFLVAALFALHSMNVETVAWVAERKSLLCTLFSLLAMLAYGWYAGNPNLKRYAAVAGALVLALLSKPMAVSIPLVFLLMDYWPLERYHEQAFLPRCKTLLLEKVPLFLISLGASLVTMAAQRPNSVMFLLPGPLPIQYKLGNALVSYTIYIQKLLWPTDQAVLYPHPGRTLSPLRVVVAVVILSVISAVMVRLRHRARYLLMGWLFFLITLIPVIGIVQVGCQAMADRYTYFPYIGLFIMLAWGLAAIVDRYPDTALLACALSAVMIVGYAWCAVRYLAYWHDGVPLFTRATALAPRPGPYLEEFLADELISNGDVDGAFEHFKKSCAAYPAFDMCHFNLGQYYFRQYEFAKALEQYQLAEKVTRDNELKLHSLIFSGQILFNQGQYSRAAQAAEGALQMNPDNPDALELRRRLLDNRIAEANSAVGRP